MDLQKPSLCLSSHSSFVFLSIFSLVPQSVAYHINLESIVLDDSIIAAEIAMVHWPKYGVTEAQLLALAFFLLVPDKKFGYGRLT